MTAMTNPSARNENSVQVSLTELRQLHVARTEAEHAAVERQRLEHRPDGVIPVGLDAADAKIEVDLGERADRDR